MVRRGAVLIGINYRGQQGELNGCINDVNNKRDDLIAAGYHPNDIIVLTDDTELQPTRVNIISAILSLLLSEALRLYIHYSGHGSYIRDVNADESDGVDETIVPLDYSTAGMITDDQLRALLEFMNPSAKLTIILDCCHSGSGMDLCYSINEITRTRRNRKYTSRYMRKNRKYRETPGEVLMISGCQDSQTSADAWESNEYQGALSYSLREAMKTSPRNWEELFVKTRMLLIRNGYDQVPNLTSGRSLNLREKVDLYRIEN